MSATLDTPQVALQAMNEGRWPLLVKIHGDFQSRRLKNTRPELRGQDAELRRALVEGCKRYGLAVVGYSGRDQSVMDALEEAITDGHGYPSGLFWFHRAQSRRLPRVDDLLAKAVAAGIEARAVAVETFDELMADLLLLLPDIPADVAAQLDMRARRVSDAPIPSPGGKKNWPIVRLNALPILGAPTVCRRVVCDIGGTKEVRRAIEDAGVGVLAARRQVGVICFGGDADVRKTFAPFGITTFDLHAIEPQRLRYESAELGLLYDALCRALERERPLRVERRKTSALVVVEPAREEADALGRLRQATRGMAGTVPGTRLAWAEAARIRLEYRLDRLWLLLEPTIWVAPTDDDDAFAKGRDFIRDRLAGRFNKAWNGIIDAWVDVIVGGAPESEIRTLGIADGIDAAFTISKITGFSRREVQR